MSSSRRRAGRGFRSTPRIASTARRATSRTRPRTSTGSSPKAEEGRTIPTCEPPVAPAKAGAPASGNRRRLSLAGIPAFAGMTACALLAATPAAATLDETSALAAYVRARAADSSGAAEQAARNYGAALALAPENEVLAARALSQAIAAGDRPLALQAARTLDSAGKLAPDGRLLLVGEAFRAKQWKEAGAADRPDRAGRGLLVHDPAAARLAGPGQRQGRSAGLLAAASGNALAATYASEHRPLLLIAGGKAKEGAAALAPCSTDESIRSQRLRIAAAAMLARKGLGKEALALLQGDSEALVEARRRVEAGKSLGGEIVTPGRGDGRAARPDGARPQRPGSAAAGLELRPPRHLPRPGERRGLADHRRSAGRPGPARGGARRARQSVRRRRLRRHRRPNGG